jgi:hypothetical protein
VLRSSSLLPSVWRSRLSQHPDPPGLAVASCKGPDRWRRDRERRRIPCDPNRSDRELGNEASAHRSSAGLHR